jgi:hypothetical protein
MYYHRSRLIQIHSMSADVIDFLSSLVAFKATTQLRSAALLRARERPVWCLEIGAAIFRRLRDNLLNITTNIQRDIINLKNALPRLETLAPSY